MRTQACANQCMEFKWLLSTQPPDKYSTARKQSAGSSVSRLLTRAVLCQPRRDSALAPIALKDEGSPSIRDGVRFCLPHRYLRGPERGGRTQSILQHPLVKQLHQVGCGLIVYIPQAGHDAWRPGVHKSARQTDEPVTRGVPPPAALAPD